MTFDVGMGMFLTQGQEFRIERGLRRQMERAVFQFTAWIFSRD